MTIAKKLLIVLLILGVGLGTALLFRKSPGSPNNSEAVSLVSSLEATVASVSTGRLSLRHLPDGTVPHAFGGPGQRSDEFMKTTDRTVPASQATNRPNAESVENGVIQPANRSTSETTRSAQMREMRAFAPVTNLVGVLANDPDAEVPALPGSFPIGRAAGKHLRPVYATVNARDRPVPSGDAEARSLPETHRVVDGDTLENLARRYFDDPRRATLIYELNRDRIDDPHLLTIGIDLRLRL